MDLLLVINQNFSPNPERLEKTTPNSQSAVPSEKTQAKQINNVPKMTPNGSKFSFLKNQKLRVFTIHKSHAFTKIKYKTGKESGSTDQNEEY